MNALIPKPALLAPLTAPQQKQFNKVCDLIATGQSLRKACKAKGTPAPTTVIKWMNTDDGGSLSKQYASAREAQATHYADCIIDAAEDDNNDTPDKINRARVKIDAYKWTAAKLRPGTYGDQRDQNANVASVTVIIEGRDADCG